MYVLFKILAGWFVLSVTAAAGAPHFSSADEGEQRAEDYRERDLFRLTRLSHS